MSAMRNDALRTFFITVGGSGYAPFASGSWGSLAALAPFVVVWVVAAQTSSRLALELVTLLGIVGACALSVVWGQWAIDKFNSKDPKPFVLDEFAGQWVALLALPIGLQADAWTLACLLASQLFWFRFFDVLKPPPAAQMEKLPAGWGILIDDLFAGLYANIVGQLLWRLTPLAGWLGARVSQGWFA